MEANGQLACSYSTHTLRLCQCVCVFVKCKLNRMIYRLSIWQWFSWWCSTISHNVSLMSHSQNESFHITHTHTHKFADATVGHGRLKKTFVSKTKKKWRSHEPSPVVASLYSSLCHLHLPFNCRIQNGVDNECVDDDVAFLSTFLPFIRFIVVPLKHRLNLISDSNQS